MPYEIDDRWIELDYGDLDGVRLADVDHDVWAQWRADPHYRVGGGETLAEMHKRVVSAAEGTARRCRGAVDRRDLPRLTDQSRGHMGVGGRRDRWVEVPSGSGLRVPNSRWVQGSRAARLQRDTPGRNFLATVISEEPSRRPRRAPLRGRGQRGSVIRGWRESAQPASPSNVVEEDYWPASSSACTRGIP